MNICEKSFVNVRLSSSRYSNKFLQYNIDKTFFEVKHYLHRQNIPESTNPFAIDWICGEFLLALFGMGELSDNDYLISPM
jgi:hypothetical protein